MRRGGYRVLVRIVALTAAALAALILSAGAATAGPAASLSLAAHQPLTVAGAHFVPRQWVRVTAYATKTATLRVRANARGAFTVRFATVTYGRCGAFRIVAAGARGRIASLKIPLPACMPARSP